MGRLARAPDDCGVIKGASVFTAIAVVRKPEVDLLVELQRAFSKRFLVLYLLCLSMAISNLFPIAGLCWTQRKSIDCLIEQLLSMNKLHTHVNSFSSK